MTAAWGLQQQAADTNSKCVAAASTSAALQTPTRTQLWVTASTTVLQQLVLHLMQACVPEACSVRLTAVAPAQGNHPTASAAQGLPVVCSGTTITSAPDDSQG